MKKMLLFSLLFVFGLTSCETECGDYIKGKRGGCYYINKNGNKTYVDRSLCNC